MRHLSLKRKNLKSKENENFDKKKKFRLKIILKINFIEKYFIYFRLILI
jgi:hypothetical protein